MALSVKSDASVPTHSSSALGLPRMRFMHRMMKNSHRYLALLLLPHAQGCTTVVVNATGGGTVIGRTMELGIPLPDRASNEIWSLVATQRDEKRFGYAAISAALGGATSEAFVVAVLYL